MTERGRESGVARERGQSLVEFAVVIAALLALALGALEVGRATFVAQHAAEAARTLARVAATTPGDLTAPVATSTGALPAGRFFDPNLVEVDLDALEAAYPDEPTTLAKADAYLRDMALLRPAGVTENATLGNRLLAPVMEVDLREGGRFLRLPVPAGEDGPAPPYVYVALEEAPDGTLRLETRVPITFLTLGGPFAPLGLTLTGAAVQLREIR